MIFISGVHGVGKSFFCHIIQEKLGINCYSASSLIAEQKGKNFTTKLVADIDDNQQLLLRAVEDLRKTSCQFILDGHFCLLNSDGKVSRVPFETFDNLHPQAIVLLTERSEVISERRKVRDGINISVDSISEFQAEEIAYAQEIASILNIQLFISSGAEDTSCAIEFIKQMEE